MLMQEWFNSKNMIQFYEYLDEERYFDEETHGIYVVTVDCDEHIVITEYQPKSDGYDDLYEEYLGFGNR